MKFRTEIEIPLVAAPLDYSSRILSLGSCFALSVGAKLCEAKFSACVNPTGVLFNPLSIAGALRRFASGREVALSELEQGREGWFHFGFHSSLGAPTSSEAIARINAAIAVGHKALAQCDALLVTLGTAWVYSLCESGEVVASCHKEPSSRFERRRVSTEEIVEVLGAELSRYPDKRFIFSVSPIRHLADGLDENSLSKATLRVAIAQLCELYDNARYFPSYEILIDDLRDYRFYADDMLHPSSQAVEYIWSKFCSSQLSKEAQTTMEGVQSILRAAAHRPFNPSSSAYSEFCRKQLELIAGYPNLDFGKESAHFKSFLQNNL